MDRIEFGSHDLNSPAGRLTILKRISPIRSVVRQYHTELLDLFRREMVYRSVVDEEPSSIEESDIEPFEHLYWCALLLYFIGDPNDVPLMWEAKHLNMDTGCGFDPQYLVGAGVEETIRFADTSNRPEIATYLRDIRAYGDFDNLAEWESYRVHYFYRGQVWASE